MNFIEYKLTRKIGSKYKNSVRVGFISKKSNKSKYSIMIRIGSDLANKIDIKPGDKVSFSYDDENKRIWFIKKTNNLTGYKIGGRQDDFSFTIQISWDSKILFEPEENEISMHCVPSDIFQQGIKINFLRR